MYKNKPSLNKRLRDYRNSLGLVECRLWLTKEKSIQLKKMYPKPILPAGYAANGDK